MVRSRPPGSDELVTDAAREGQVGDRGMQMSEPATAEPELNPTEAMVMSRHALPASDFGAHGLHGRAWRYDLPSIFTSKTPLVIVLASGIRRA